MTTDLTLWVLLTMVALGIAFVVIVMLMFRVDVLERRMKSAESLTYLQGDWLLSLTHDVHGPIYIDQASRDIVDDWLNEAKEATEGQS